jgi:hypothetical protein
VHAHFTWCFDAYTHLIALNTQYRHVNVVSNDYGFADSSGQDQHCCLPPILFIIISVAVHAEMQLIAGIGGLAPEIPSLKKLGGSRRGPRHIFI